MTDRPIALHAATDKDAGGFALAAHVEWTVGITERTVAPRGA
ncbi:hypothetical protein GGR34_002093 [Microvirga flocculans]|uniref:Uncharacterized protein n=1 Tax=Microvirga flocculans TaxID=217168 RepID=A0A7W6N8H8_9HYPH|nr:hypothetical protein [Microvirga flocculans]MBB4040440.1 hypothetical protein [Microvirga flocculans]